MPIHYSDPVNRDLFLKERYSAEGDAVPFSLLCSGDFVRCPCCFAMVKSGAVGACCHEDLKGRSYEVIFVPSRAFRSHFAKLVAAGFLGAPLDCTSQYPPLPSILSNAVINSPETR